MASYQQVKSLNQMLPAIAILGATFLPLWQRYLKVISLDAPAKKATARSVSPLL